MDRDLVTYGFRVLQTLTALYGVLYVALGIGHPRAFLDHVAIGRLMEPHRKERWWFWPVALLVACCVGVLVWSALYAVIAAVPYSWGSHDEDGEWTSSRFYLRSTGTIFGTIALMGGIERNATILVRNEP
jgi:hypothetical protein